MLPRRELLAHPAVVTGAVALLAMLIVLPNLWAPINYDEGYNLQIVGNLLHGHGYSTNAVFPGGPPRLFDYRVTTGPTLMLPVTAAAWLFGEHMWAYRLVPMLFYGLLVGAWWRLARTTFGLPAAVAAVVGVVLLGGLSVTGVQPLTVVGEICSAALIMVALQSLRLPLLCGLLIGLAIMTKVLVLLAVPGVVLALLLQVHRDRSSAFGALARWTLGLLAPVLAWQLVHIVVLGWSRAMHLDLVFLAFMNQDGSGSPWSALRAIQQVFLVGPLASFAVIFAAVLIIVSCRTRAGRAVIAHSPPAWIGVLVSGAGFELWWLALEGQGWPRHALQAVFLLVPWVLATTTQVLPRIHREAPRRVLAGAVGALVVAQAALTASSWWIPQPVSLDDQRDVADVVASHVSVYQYDMVDPTEMTLLNTRLQSRPVGGSRGLLVIDHNLPGTDLKKCGEVMQRIDGYVLCWTRGTS